MTTSFQDAAARVATGAEAAAEARGLVELMTPDERLEMLDGNLDFWPGLADMIGGGYHEHTFPGSGCPRLGVPPIEFSDGPRGVVVGDATCFPVSMARAATWDPGLEERIGEAIGRELRARGATLYGGVCINLLRHPAWGRAQETYGEDPLLLGEMGAALARGVQRWTMACVKHFALNSMENSRFRVDVTVDDRTLHEVYLPHFRRVVDEGVASVMSAYNSVNGAWCGDSRALLTEVLRDEWGFDGFVVSDFIFGLRDAAASVRGGMDVEMPFRMIRHQHLRRQLDDGAVTWDEVDTACTRIVATLLRFDPVLSRPAPEPEVIASPAHRALALEAASRSIVLLRNEGGALPLDAERQARVGVFGRLADTPNLGDRGSSRVHPPSVVTPLGGLRAVLRRSEVLHDDGADPRSAAELAATCDAAIVVVGYTHVDEGEYVGLEGSAHLAPLYPPQTPETPELLKQAFERAARGETAMGPGGDRADLRLHPDDEALITAVGEACPRTIVAVMAGSAVVMEAWRERVPAIVMLWYPGMEGGTALADVLTGQVEPTGRLPFTIPTDPAHLPPFDRDATTATYDRWHGYGRLHRDGHEPAFAFGFGLSYTNLSLARPSVHRHADGELEVEVTVVNAGPRPGRELVQVYAGLPGSSVERSPTTLVGFVLTPVVPSGGEHEATVRIDRSRLQVWQPATRSWWLEPGTYELVVARSAADPLAHRLTVALP